MLVRLVILVLTMWWPARQCLATEASVPDSVRKYRFLAKAARDKGEHEAAIAYYREYLKYQPDDVLAHYRLGQACLSTGDGPAAKQALYGALALDSLHVNSNLLLYSIYAGDDAPDSAAACLERVVSVRPDDVEKRRALADLYGRMGATERAIEHYEKLAEQLDEPAELVQLLAALHEDAGDVRAALRWRSRLLGGSREQGDVAGELEALESMLRLQLAAGEIDTAYQTLEALARIDTANRYSYYSRMATLAQEFDDAAMRLRGWEGMVAANPRDVETVAALAEHCLNENRLERAEAWLRRGLRVEGDNAHLQLLRGDLLVRKGDDEGALAAFELAKANPRWEAVAQQRIWQLRPPETAEEKLRKAFFGAGKGSSGE